MSEVVLKISDLGKQYRLGQVGTGTLSHDVNKWLAKIRGKEDPYKKIGVENNRAVIQDSDYVWALQGVSFELNRGDVLGVIGRNGAGKSTLLKLLSKITAPSTGEIKIKGKIASLLEVGTGFHPELTGMENIYLNGAILGMNKAEISQKLEQIIEFSGCSSYINTPVKRYSSGMLVRLGFSVAAHMDPDILVVDEVLAVGDLEFQQKCLGKMSEVSQSGRTILFVSHNMQAVGKLCNKGVYLKNGQMVSSGLIGDILEEYIKSTTIDNFKYVSTDEAILDGVILSAEILNQNDIATGEIGVGENWKVKVVFQLIKDLRHIIVGVGFTGVLDENVNTTWSTPRDLGKGKYEVTFQNKEVLFSAGTYYVSIGLSTFERSISYIPSAISFVIIENGKIQLDSRIVRFKGNGLILNQMTERFMSI
jgi:lipopolysaccharide transport system ATP-binding protein